MKSKEELSQIARDVALEMGYVEHAENEQQIGVVKIIVEALARVQDEALNVRFEFPNAFVKKNEIKRRAKSAPLPEYRPWVEMGLTEVEYFKAWGRRNEPR